MKMYFIWHTNVGLSGKYAYSKKTCAIMCKLSDISFLNKIQERTRYRIIVQRSTIKIVLLIHIDIMRMCYIVSIKCYIIAVFALLQLMA